MDMHPIPGPGPGFQSPGFHLATDLLSAAPFHLLEGQLEKHMVVLGATGSGKSKFLELLMRHLHLAKRGFCLIDPHGDLSEDILAFAARRRIELGTDAIYKVIHYLEPGYDVLFGYDPFQFNPSRPIPESLRRNAYIAWLHTKVDRVSEIIQRKQGQTDFEGMPRLQRILRDVLYAIGIQVDDSGKHLPLSDALVLLDPKHNRHADVYAHVVKHLDPDIRSDFERIIAYKRVEDRLRETESTINRLRSLFSPILQAIFSRAGNTIDFRAIMQRREMLLVNLRETDYFSADQAAALGGLFIHQILSTAATTDREKRSPYYLIVDEAARFIGDDLQRALGECRKYKLSVCLAAQDLSSFKKKDFDMTPKVLSQCRTQICFQQQYPDDLEILAKHLGYGTLDFTEHLQVADRPDGYDWHKNVEESEGTSTGTSWSQGESKGETDTTSRQRSRTESTQENWQHGQSHQLGMSESTSSGTNSSETVGSSWSDTEGNSWSDTEGDSESRSVTDSMGLSISRRAGTPTRTETGSMGRSAGHTVGKSQSHTEGGNRSHTEGGSHSHTAGSSEAHAIGRTEMKGKNESTGGGHGSSVGESTGEAHSRSRSTSTSRGGSDSTSRTVSHRNVPLARYREEWQNTGRLARSVEDQFHRMKQLIYSLPMACAIVKLVDQPQSFPIKVETVSDPFPLPQVKAHVVDVFKRMLYQTHPYFFRPSFSPEEQDRRIDEFLALQGPEDQSSDAREGDSPHNDDPFNF